MKLNSKSIKWAVEFVVRHSDGDIFPPLPEISAVGELVDNIVNSLGMDHIETIKPQPFRRFLVPKGDLAYRRATQLHPQDSILLTSIVYQYGSALENQRLDADTVFSNRFDPTTDLGLYKRQSSWNDFWKLSQAKAKDYGYVLYCDIADFYNQINHHILENRLQGSGFPPEVCHYITELFKSPTVRISQGLPVGPHAVHLFAESTLISIDNALRTEGIDFLRYADDIHVFCPTYDVATRASWTIANTLDRQQHLMIQQHKTRITPSEEFQQHCSEMIEDRPISEEEKELLDAISKYDGGNPYIAVTFDQISPADWEKFSDEIIQGIVEDYLYEPSMNVVRLRWFFRRLAQVGHPGALPVVLANFDALEPCLPDICSYITSIRSVEPNQWVTLGDQLLSLLKSNPAFENEFSRLSVLSLFSRNADIDHFPALVELYRNGTSDVRREVLLAAKINGESDWLRNQKEDFSKMNTWEQLAFMYAATTLPKSERQAFFKGRQYACRFDKQLSKWSLEQP